MPLAAILIAVFVATVLATRFALAHSDGPWTIVVVSESLRAGGFIFLVILAHALLLGLPLFLFLRSRIRVGLIVCLAAGFLVGAVPLPLLGLLATSGGNYSAWTGGTPIVVNGIPTLAGLLQHAQIAGLFGAFGLAAAFTFWAILRWSGGSALEPFANRASREIPRPRQWLVALAAILLTCGVVILPGVVIDRSCHNLFLDGRSSVSPQIFSYIELNAEDWPKLKQIFSDFGSAHSLELRTDQNVRDGKLLWRDLNLCNEMGVNIDALDQPWLIEVKSPTPRGVKLAVYEMKPYSGWGPLARDLVGKIAAGWPEKIKFHGPDGRVISEAEALKGRPQ
jgi:hypothetical protein